MKKRSFTRTLVITAMMALLTVGANAADIEVGTYDALFTAFETATDADTIKLTDFIEFGQGTVTLDGQGATLDMNGKSIKLTQGETPYTFTLKNVDVLNNHGTDGIVRASGPDASVVLDSVTASAVNTRVILCDPRVNITLKDCDFTTNEAQSYTTSLVRATGNSDGDVVLENTDISGFHMDLWYDDVYYVTCEDTLKNFYAPNYMEKPATLFNDITLTQNITTTLTSSRALVIPEGLTLTIAEDATFTLTHNKSIHKSGDIVNNGKLALPANADADDIASAGITGSGIITVGGNVHVNDGTTMVNAFKAAVEAKSGTEDYTIDSTVDATDDAALKNAIKTILFDVHGQSGDKLIKYWNPTTMQTTGCNPTYYEFVSTTLATPDADGSVTVKISYKDETTGATDTSAYEVTTTFILESAKDGYLSQFEQAVLDNSNTDVYTIANSVDSSNIDAVKAAVDAIMNDVHGPTGDGLLKYWDPETQLTTGIKITYYDVLETTPATPDHNGSIKIKVSYKDETTGAADQTTKSVEATFILESLKTGLLSRFEAAVLENSAANVYVIDSTVDATNTGTLKSAMSTVLTKVHGQDGDGLYKYFDSTTMKTTGVEVTYFDIKAKTSATADADGAVTVNLSYKDVSTDAVDTTPRKVTATFVLESAKNGYLSQFEAAALANSNTDVYTIDNDVDATDADALKTAIFDVLNAVHGPDGDNLLKVFNPETQLTTGIKVTYLDIGAIVLATENAAGSVAVKISYKDETTDAADTTAKSVNVVFVLEKKAVVVTPPTTTRPTKPTVTPVEPEVDFTFTDVTKDDWYYEAVKWAVKNEITSGKTDTIFAPMDVNTRAEAVSFLYYVAGQPAVKGENPFTDVSEDAWYHDAVLWAVEKGITAGTSDTTFAPNSVCTRSQIIALLYRAAGSPDVTGENPYTDVSTDAYYYDAMIWAIKNGITGGTSATTFSPDMDCTRAQIVSFLYRNSLK